MKSTVSLVRAALAFACVALSVTFFPRTGLAFDPLPALPPVPKDNPQTPEKIELGKQLFFDPRLSQNGSVSCNSCHNLMGSGGDNLATSIGVLSKHGLRSAPTVWNAAFLSVQFWDGRAKNLEEQAKGPLLNPVEMAMASHDLVMRRVRDAPGYVDEFEKIFGKNSVNIDNATRAIAAFERTLITSDGPFDRYLKGDKKALSDKQIAGMKKFEETGCPACHSGPNFSGPPLPEGTGFYQKFPLVPGSEYEKKYELTKDLGRYMVTKSDSDKNLWRVPTLRNIALTAPYFHNGSVKTLHEAVKVMAKTQLAKDITDDDANLLVAFLGTLTGKFPDVKMPRLPPNENSSFEEAGEPQPKNN